jgi:glycosyltransferase involved in cell wall biosynthesis
VISILHVVLTPRLSGAEVLVKDLAIEQRRRGSRVAISALAPEEPDFRSLHEQLAHAGVVCRFPPRRLGPAGRLAFMWRTIIRCKPDVVFAHATIPSFYVRALPIAVPVVYVMHSASDDFARPLFRRVESVLSRRASAIVAVSDALLAGYAETVRRHPRMHVVLNGVDIARFTRPPWVAQADQAPRIVQVGRYAAVKNQLNTLRAFGRVLERVPNAQLSFHGLIEDADYHAAVVRLTEEMGLAGHVTVGGPRTDVAELLAQASAFAMPSRSEGHSIAFLEALASGVPIVASAIAAFGFARAWPGVQLLDTDDVSGYAAALASALHAPRTSRRLEGLTLTDTVDQYARIAREVIDDAR